MVIEAVSTLLRNAAPPADNSLALVAIAISLLSAGASVAVVWQQWRYRQTVAWVLQHELHDPRPRLKSNNRVQDGDVRWLRKFTFHNRGNISASHVRVWGGIGPHGGMHQDIWATPMEVRPDNSFEFELEVPYRNEGAQVLEHMTITWRQRPNVSKLHQKVYRLDGFDETRSRATRKHPAGKALAPRYRNY